MWPFVSGSASKAGEVGTDDLGEVRLSRSQRVLTLQKGEWRPYRRVCYLTVQRAEREVGATSSRQVLGAVRVTAACRAFTLADWQVGRWHADRRARKQGQVRQQRPNGGK